MSESDTDEKIAIEWWSAHGWQHRIKYKPIPGSAHWNVIMESRGPGGSWDTEWAAESRHKPKFPNKE